MDVTRSIPIVLCLMPPPGPNAARTVSYPGVLRDTLRHYGLPFTAVDVADLAAALPAAGVLITVGDGVLSEATKTALREWIEGGGEWIAVAGTCGLADMLGVEVEGPAFASWGGGVGTLGEGYTKPTLQDIRTAHIAEGLHHFNGLPVRALIETVALADAHDKHGRPTGRAAMTEAKHGEGHGVLIAADLPGALVRIRQGIGITRDGVPASDGTAPICDEVLKSGDGFALDWDFDRQDVPGVPGFKAFLEPQADQWAELLVRTLLRACERRGVRLPMLWLYPRNLPAVAMLSHDTDNNNPDLAKAMLDVLADLGIRSTWCVILPGYPPEVIERIRAAGHEPAMHYDAMTDGLDWSPTQFDRQHGELTRLLGGPPVTNKNHYLRWEGDTDLFEWCADHGIRLDQSKGASKTGEAGYNFGTCHPYMPVRRDGSTVPVYEVATPTQDLIVFAPAPLAEALTRSVLRAHGILHLLFHPAHIATAGVADALRAAVRNAQEHGMEWWTAREIADWEDARRAVCWEGYQADASGSVCVELSADAGLKDAVMLFLHPQGDTERFGFRFDTIAFSAAAGERARLEFQR